MRNETTYFLNDVICYNEEGVWNKSGVMVRGISFGNKDPIIDFSE